MSIANGSPHRLFIFGWDCADWIVIEEGWRRGMLPHLRAIADRGESGTLLSTIPPVTAPAWTSFLTGKDPGEHGIFGFRSVDPEDYRSVTIPGGRRRGSTLFKQADEAGYRTCLVTVPWTYPPERLTRGVVVPGWDAPDESPDSCYPPALGEELAKIVERIPRRNPGRSSVPRFLERQRQNIALRERICSHLIARTNPHIFMTVFPEPDQVTHLFWGKTEIPESLLLAYEAVDESMGRIISEHVGPADRIVVLSDHGARPIHTYVHVGKVLEDGGFLTLTGDDGQRSTVARGLKRRVWYRLPPKLRLALLRNIPRSARRRASRAVRGNHIDWRVTRAFPGDEGPGLGVIINVRPPFKHGPVFGDEYESVRRDVISYLSAVTDPQSGEPAFDRVLPREDVYEGPTLASAPDVVLVPAPGFGTRRGLDFTERTSRVAVGGHRREGMFVASWGLGLGSVAHIRDLLPRALESCGYEHSASVDPQDEDLGGYTDLEAEEMGTRLRELGYIE
jgi:predicted AlkP superfamily phosphohydrolase/phosphomutase